MGIEQKEKVNFDFDKTLPMYVLALQAQSGLINYRELLGYLLSLPGNQ